MRQHADVQLMPPASVTRLREAIDSALANEEDYYWRNKDINNSLTSLKRDISNLKDRMRIYDIRVHLQTRLQLRNDMMYLLRRRAKQKRERERIQEGYLEAQARVEDVCCNLFREPSRTQPIILNKEVIDKQVSALPFVWKHKYYVVNGTGYLRVWFKPYTMRRFNAYTNRYGWKKWRCYPFKITLKLPPSMDLEERFLGHYLTIHKVRVPKTDKYLLPYPHCGCLGSAEPHLIQSLQYGAIGQFLGIYHEYFSMANVLDQWGNRYRIFRDREHEVPLDEELTEAHYRRYIPHDPTRSQ